MGANEDIDFATRGSSTCGGALGVGAEAGEDFDAEGKGGHAIAEGRVVLFGEDGGWGEEDDLFVVDGGNEGCAHGEFCFAIAGVATEEAVHGDGGGHVGFDFLKRAELVTGFLPWEEGFEFVYPGVVDVKGESAHNATAGLGLKKGGREVFNGILRGGAFCMPAFATEAVEFNVFALGADVAREEVSVSGGDVEFEVIGIEKGEDFCTGAVEFNFAEAKEAADTMLEMNDEFARLEVKGVFKVLTGDGFALGWLGAEGTFGGVKVALGEEGEVEVFEVEALAEGVL